MKKTKLFSIGQIKPFAYVGSASPLNPLLIVVNQIPANCSIRFNRIEFKDGLFADRQVCGLPVIHDATIEGSFVYKICSCTPTLDVNNTTLVIDAIGAYEAVLVGSCASSGTVDAFVQEAKEYIGVVTDSMRGCCGQL